MKTRNRDRDEQQRDPAGGVASPAGDGNRGGQQLRDRANRLLELGDEAINHALSQNSARYLEQNQQQGGE